MEKENAIKATTFACLHAELRSLESYRVIRTSAVKIGLSDLEDAFPDQAIPTGVMHECVCPNYPSATSTYGFLFALLSKFPEREKRVVWVGREPMLFPHGLRDYGLNPSSVIFMQRRKEQDLLWTMEAALQTKGLLAVIGEVQDIDFVSTKRLQLAIESSGVTGFVIRHCPKKDFISAAHVRWLITPAPSIMPDGMPGIGHPCWNLNLLKVKNGRPAQINTQWKNNQFIAFEPRFKSVQRNFLARSS